ncbi:LytTR family DNA-binding domain-containing protein [uncultured Kordia sp.]|uniref:LytR/AlgR family response regulator transcription factor n=1 Tax=uncultured Kordia sp. TaxID=507699 RepID=UPI00261653A3|nr:LytTR family DNA-binding domain-containing protein [uncultured Kordia sp.]
MIKAIIVEDEKSSMEYLTSILNRNHKNIKILGWASDVHDAVTLIKKKEPELVFLDIQLNTGSGFEVLDQLQNEMTFEVIFTTGFVDYKEKAMDYFAFYYLNKPIQEEQLKKVLDMYELKRSAFDRRKYEAFKLQIENKHTSITIYEKSEYTTIRISNILYCEAAGSYTTIHLRNNQQLLFSRNLKSIENMLEHSDFFRVHRSYLVNLQNVKKVTHDGIMIMIDNKEIATSSRNRKKVIDLLKLYNSKTL